MANKLKEQYERDGFLILEDFLSPEEIKTLRDEGDNLIKNMPGENERVAFNTQEAASLQNKNRYFLESADKLRFFYEEGALGPGGKLLVDPQISLMKVGHAIHLHNPVFRKLTFDDRIKKLTNQLGFEEPIVVQSMYLFKNPDVGSEIITHQDASYLHTEPVRVIGFWFALEDATLQNGCLWFDKGSHTDGIHRRYIRNPDKTSEDLLIYSCPPPDYKREEFTPVPVKKGTCVIIHGKVVHYSAPNKSKKSRHAYTFHVTESRDTKYSDNNWLQPTPEQPFLKLYEN